MIPLRPAVLAVLVVLALSEPARAGFVNGGFESGFATWATTGDASVVTSSVGVAPVEGTRQAFLTTASDNGDFNNFSGTDAVLAAALESFLGVSPGTLGTGFEGSAIRQTFTASAGDVLTFRYKFLTTEGAANDFAFVTLSGFGFAVLADTTAADLGPSSVVLDPIFYDPGSGDPPSRETAWRTFTYTFAAAGSYTLGIGVADDGDKFNPSAVLVDDVRLADAGNAVPAPPAWALLGIGLAVCGLARRVRTTRCPNAS